MGKRRRRDRSAAFRARVALAAIEGEKALADLAQQFDVRASQISTWRTQVLEGAAGVFGADGGASRRAPSTWRSCALSPSEHVEADPGAQGLSLFAAQAGDHPAQPGLGCGHQLYKFGLNLTGGVIRLTAMPGPGAEW